MILKACSSFQTSLGVLRCIIHRRYINQTEKFETEEILLKEAIEQAVNRRQKRKAIGMIQRYRPPRGSQDWEKVFEICEWCRRLGEFEKAYDLLDIQGLIEEKNFQKPSNRRRLLWGARILNLLGAGKQALNLLNLISHFCPNDYLHIANIYFSNSKYIESIEFFRKTSETFDEMNSREVFLSHLGIADSYAVLKNFRDSIRHLRKAKRFATTQIQKAIYLQAGGEYLLRNGKYRFGMNFMLKPMNRTKAREDFLIFSSKVSS